VQLIALDDKPRNRALQLIALGYPFISLPKSDSFTGLRPHRPDNLYKKRAPSAS